MAVLLKNLLCKIVLRGVLDLLDANVSESAIGIKFPIGINEDVPRKPLILADLTTQSIRSPLADMQAVPASLVEKLSDSLLSLAKRCIEEEPLADFGT